MKQTLLFLFFFIASSTSSLIRTRRQIGARNAMDVSPCRSGEESSAPIPVNVIVPKCDYPPCYLERGETYDVEVDFDVPRDIRRLSVEVTGIIDGSELPWTGVREDGCRDMIIGRCPLKEGEYWTYGVNITVERIYPVTPLIIKWQMKDDNQVAIWCFELPARIT